MTKLETLEQEAYDNNINVYYRDITLDGFCIKDNVCINKHLGTVKKFWVLEHELQHLELDQLYTIESTDKQVAYRERKVNDAIIKKYQLDQLVLLSLRNGCDKWETCFECELPFELYDATLNYLKRKGLMDYEKSFDVAMYEV